MARLMIFHGMIVHDSCVSMSGDGMTMDATWHDHGMTMVRPTEAMT